MGIWNGEIKSAKVGMGGYKFNYKIYVKLIISNTNSRFSGTPWQRLDFKNNKILNSMNFSV